MQPLSDEIDAMSIVLRSSTLRLEPEKFKIANDMVDEMDAMLLSLIEKEIPDGRKALVDSHKNLSVLSNYCKENYFNRSADFYFFIFFFFNRLGLLHHAAHK